MKERLFHKRQLGYAKSTKRSPLEFQPERAQGKAWDLERMRRRGRKEGFCLGSKAEIALKNRTPPKWREIFRRL